jgi:hypothetical protein
MLKIMDFIVHYISINLNFKKKKNWLCEGWIRRGQEAGVQGVTVPSMFRYLDIADLELFHKSSSANNKQHAAVSVQFLSSS